MKNVAIILAVALVLSVGIGIADAAVTIASSTMYFQGALTDAGNGRYVGVLNMLKESTAGVGDGVDGFDIYAKEGATAWFGDKVTVLTPQTITSHDDWPTWTPDTPDWYQYSIKFSLDGDQAKWALQNHAGSTESAPHSTIARGIPMSGTMDWSTLRALETDTGAYLPGTGTPELPGGVAGKVGSGAGAWDMDWSWGSEYVPLEYSAFAVTVEDLGNGQYRVSLAPVPEPAALVIWSLLGGLGVAVALRRRGRAA